MRQHELRLVPVTHESGCGFVPYCICGWIGEEKYIGEQEAASNDYLEHAVLANRRVLGI